MQVLQNPKIRVIPNETPKTPGIKSLVKPWKQPNCSTPNSKRPKP